MSVTIKSTPADYSSAQGDLIYVVFDDTRPQDPATYQNFKYTCSVFINGGINPVATINKVPQPDTFMGVFSIGDIVRNYVSANFNPIASSLVAQQSGEGEWNVNVVSKFLVQYFDVSGTVYDPSSGYSPVDSSRTFFNHYNGRLTGNLTSLTDYGDKALTNRPLVNGVMLTDNYSFLPYFPKTAGAFAVQVKTYLGSSLAATYNTTITPTGANYLQLLNVSPAGINAAFPGAITAATTSYTVQLNSGAVYTFNINCENIFTVYNLHFLNKLGGFESRNFTKLSRKTIDITKTDFGKLPYTVDASGNVNYWNSNKVYNETRSTYASQYKEKLSLNSDLLTDDDFAWLQELIVSPLVYIEINGYFIACTITANSYEKKKYVNDKLSNLQVDIEFGDQFNAQYR